jgi:hypothetical protein
MNPPACMFGSSSRSVSSSRFLTSIDTIMVILRTNSTLNTKLQGSPARPCTPGVLWAGYDQFDCAVPLSQAAHVGVGHGSGSRFAIPSGRLLPAPHRLEVWPVDNGSELISSKRYRPGPRPSITRFMPTWESAVPIGSLSQSLTRRMRGTLEGPHQFCVERSNCRLPIRAETALSTWWSAEALLRTVYPLIRQRKRINGSELGHHAFEWVADEVAYQRRVMVTLYLRERKPPIRESVTCGQPSMTTATTHSIGINNKGPCCSTSFCMGSSNR